MCTQIQCVLETQPSIIEEKASIDDVSLNLQKTLQSSTGNVTFPDDYTVNLETGSPVWYAMWFDFTKQIDRLKFDLSFLSGQMGYLTVFFDGITIYEFDQSTMIEDPYTLEIQLPNFEIGEHIISIRLDSFSEEEINCRNIRSEIRNRRH